LCFFITCTWIRYGVKEECESVQRDYGGECVDALMKLIADESSQYGKNSAIWTLGQLGGQKSFAIIRKI